MKKIIIGCFLSTIGVIGNLVMLLSIRDYVAMEWSTPPGRFITTVVDMGMGIPFIVSTFFLILGFLILAIEYFRVEE